MKQDVYNPKSFFAMWINIEDTFIFNFSSLIFNF